MNTKTLLISGGTSGIGRAAVEYFLREGYRVATFGISRTACDEFSRKLETQYSSDQFIVLCGDVSQEKDIKNIVDHTIKKFTRIDTLINNAGIGYFVESDKVDIDTFRSMIDVNLVGTAILTKHVIPYMKKKRGGTIINIASIAGLHAHALGEFYSSTKFAIMGYSEGLRCELEKYRIKVSTVCPGVVDTNFWNKKEKKRRVQLLGKEPAKLAPQDVIDTLRFIIEQSSNSEIREVIIVPKY